MSEQDSLDIGKVVGLIMENPQLIEQISNLAKQKNESPAPPQSIKKADEQTDTIEQATQASISPTYQAPLSNRGNRAQLLGALKPYVSEERAKAIDSMISIADILEMMRSR